jgi:transcriptional regulator with XRE-family HTH domain
MDEPTEGTLDNGRSARLAKLGAVVRRAREEAGLTQAQLGERLAPILGEVVPQTTLSRWEKGSVGLDVEMLRALELALRLRAGLLAWKGGYIEAAGEPYIDDIQTGTVWQVSEAIKHLRAAETLELGVRIHNEWVTLADGTVPTRWVIELFHEAPQVTETF